MSAVGYVGQRDPDGRKHGRGVQVWPDGCTYEGQFVNDQKEGIGVFTWPNGEYYKGSFYRDYRHGKGVYYWPGGSRFVGKFYLNQREGYGMQQFPDGTVFQGLYHMGQRFGPGVATYPDGRQDVGLWHRDRLLKLCRHLPLGVTLSDFPEHVALTSMGASTRKESAWQWRARGASVDSHLHCRLKLEDARFVLPPGIVDYSTDSDHLPLPQSLRAELDQRYFGEQGGDPRDDPTLPLEQQMQDHVHRHRFEVEALDWDVADVLAGLREHFGLKGPQEECAERLILEAERGDSRGVYRALCSAAHPDVADAQGHTAIFVAAVNCHRDVIHLLLDSGADVNKLTDEGLSAVAACLLLYYPAHSLCETVAERSPYGGPSPAWMEDSPHSDGAPNQSEPEQSISDVIDLGTRMDHKMKIDDTGCYKVDYNNELELGNKTDHNNETDPRNEINHNKEMKPSSEINLGNETDCSNAIDPSKENDLGNKIDRGSKINFNNQVDIYNEAASRSEFNLTNGAASSGEVSLSNQVDLDNEADSSSEFNLNNEVTSSSEVSPSNQLNLDIEAASGSEDKLSNHVNLDDEADSNSEFKFSNPVNFDNEVAFSGKVKPPNEIDLHDGQNGETDHINETDMSGTINLCEVHLNYEGPKLSLLGGSKGAVVRSIEVLDGQISVGSVPWPGCSGTSPEPEREGWSETADDAFDSTRSLASFRIHVTEEEFQKTAEVLSRAGLGDTKETVRQMALMKIKHRDLWATIELLLSRGGDPNTCSVPIPSLFLAIKAGHVQGVRRLLECGACTNISLPPQLKGLYPLHVAAGLSGPEGPQIVELLLHAIADPDARAQDADEAFEPVGCSLAPTPSQNTTSPQPGYRDSTGGSSGPPSQCYTLHSEPPDEGGRTALHIACQRESDHAHARDVVRVLLLHRASTNLLWSGHSPLSLAIASGNDLAVDELLSAGADPNLPLPRRVGSALCAIANISYDSGWWPWRRSELLEKLVKAGADILMPVEVCTGRRSVMGTAVDYAHFSYQQDSRLVRTPYHALMPPERELYNSRRHLLDMMGDVLRQTVVQMEQQQLDEDQMQGISSISPVQKFLYIAAGAKPSTFSQGEEKPAGTVIYSRKPVFKYCYQCGRSVGVALKACSRCKEVSYCSEACKMKAWKERHREECVRVAGKTLNLRVKESLSKRKGQSAEVRNLVSIGRAGNRTEVREKTVDELRTGQTVLERKSINPRGSLGLKENYSFI